MTVNEMVFGENNLIMPADVRWVRFNKTGVRYELHDIDPECLDEQVTAIEPVEDKLLDIYVR